MSKGVANESARNRTHEDHPLSHDEVVRDGLPAGTVTFLFTDVEGSTRLLHALGESEYAAALGEHRRVVREALAAEGGVEVDTQGDAFFGAFPTAPGALRAAARIVDDLAAGPIRVRIGLHTGTPLLTDEGYVGADVHRAARIAACGHGGQVLVSSSTRALLGNDTIGPLEGLHDLGEHRLKDLSAPERIHQLGAATFPPLRTLYRTNLPVPATPFLGREAELAEVVALLSSADARLITLVGPGGTGKTRLALQAVASVSEHHPDGVFWVPLAPVRDPALVVETIALTLDAKGPLADHFGDRSVVLYLDNVEQVADAAPELVDLLAKCPRLRILVTSRELLRVPGEHAYEVPPMAERDAVELFVSRARALDPSFAPTPAVSALCSRLDDLPLAIELAAARARLLSPEQLIERLPSRLDLLRAGRGTDPRQQTLRATIEWSHDLLDDDERRLFARLGVFLGGCTLEAAEAVCDADLDVLQSLVDKSLLRVRDDGRFWMLEMLREYAVERLTASGEAEEVRARHATYFSELAARGAPHVAGPAPGDWLDRLSAEHANLSCALDTLRARQHSAAALTLAADLGDYWYFRGHSQEGSARLASLLDSDQAGPSDARARALRTAGEMAISRGDLELGKRVAEEALAIAETSGDRHGRAVCAWQLGYIAAEEGAWGRAAALLTDSLAILREVGDDHLALGVTRILAWTNFEQGKLDEARALHEQNLAQARRMGDQAMAADLLGSLATLAVDQGRVEDALVMLRENHPIYRREGDLPGLAVNLCRMAKALAAGERHEEAVRLLACFEVLRGDLGGVEPWVDRMNAMTLASAKAHLGAAAVDVAWTEGSDLSADEAAAPVLATPG